MTKMEFDHTSARLCGRMVSMDRAIREQGAIDAEALLDSLPSVLASSPHCKGEIDALNRLIGRVNAEQT